MVMDMDMDIDQGPPPPLASLPTLLDIELLARWLA
jgi:hypothetical protein